jgi:hypothetical protein
MHYQDLGYDTYDDYLSGPEWKEIRNFFYSLSAKYRCRICHVRRDLLVHKRSYYYLQPEAFKSLAIKYVRRILVYLCPRCNRLVHYYNYKKNQRVPLDHLFLIEREQAIFWRIDMIFRRLGRDIWSFFAWVVHTYPPRDRHFRRAV